MFSYLISINAIVTPNNATTTYNNNKFSLLGENKSHFNRTKNLPVHVAPLEATIFPLVHSVHMSLLAEHFTQSTTAHATTNKYNINPHIQCPHIFFTSITNHTKTTFLYYY